MRLLRSLHTVLLAAALLLVAVGGASAQDSDGPLDATLDAGRDRQIERVLEARFGRLDGLGAVEADVEAGIVVLSGSAPSFEAAEAAERIARRTEGVAEVVKRIEVAPTLGERLLPAVDKLTESLTTAIAYLPLFGVALLVLVAFFYLSRLIAGWELLYRRLPVNPFARDLVRQVVRAVVLMVGILLALELLNATALVGAVLGTAGVFGLAVGFAFRDLVENYIASVLLSFRQPFAPNDLVEIGSHQGKVLRLTSRATVLMTLDGNHLRIPNSEVFKGVILNYSRNPLRRFDLGVGVGVDEDLERAQKLGLEILGQMNGVARDPAPSAVIDELADSNVLVRFFGWVNQSQADFTKVRSEAIRLVKTAFDDAGVDMPEPIYRLKVLEGKIPTAATPEGAAPAVARRPAVQAEVHVEDTIDRQIAAERASEPDLLDADTPLE